MSTTRTNQSEEGIVNNSEQREDNTRGLTDEHHTD